MNVTVTWRSAGSVSAGGGISVRQVFDSSRGCKGCLLTVLSVWAVILQSVPACVPMLWDPGGACKRVGSIWPY